MTVRYHSFVTPLKRYSREMINRLINSGLSGDEDFNHEFRINQVNFMTISSIICFLGFGLYALTISFWFGAYVAFGTTISNLSAFILNRNKRYNAGYLLMSLANLLSYVLIDLAYGQISGMYFLIILWLISTVFLSEKRWMFYFMFILGAVTFLGLDYYFNNYDPFFIIGREFHYLHYIIISFCLVYLYLELEFIKRIYRYYQSKLENKNLQLIKYYKAIEQTDATIVITDIKGNIEYANPRFGKTTGYPPEDALGKNPRILKSGQTPEKTFDELWKTISNGEVWHGEFINRKKDGSLYIEKATISPVFMPNGEIMNYIAIKEDITAKVQVEKALEEAQAQLARLLDRSTEHNIRLTNQLTNIFNNSLSAITFLKIEGDKILFSSCNSRLAESLGFRPEQIEGRYLSDICDADTLLLFKKYVFKALQLQRPVYEYVNWRSMHLYLCMAPLTEESDGIYCACFIYDVNDRINAENKMRESEEKFRNIFNQSMDAILILTPDLVVTEINEGFVNLLGSVTLPVNDIYDRYIPVKYHNFIRSQAEILKYEKSIPVFECELIRNDGSLVPVEITATALILNKSRVILGVIHDISNRKNFERRLIESGIQIENRERRKLALDLHDNVGPLLSSMNMCLSLLSRNPGLKDFSEDIADIRTILKDSITAVREISNNISPHSLINYGLVSALQTFFETKNKLVRIDFHSNLNGDRFSEIKEMMVYAIVKEAFNNSIKYSQCDCIRLDITKRNEYVTIIYRDNGVGFNLDEKLSSPGSNLGLVSIINRVKNLEGEYKIETSPGKGFLLEIIFPFTL